MPIEKEDKRAASVINDLHTLKAATIKNILADKISTAERFGGGNTRMKDFDDLWRIAKMDLKINNSNLKKLLHQKQSKGKLQINWINDNMNNSWKTHVKRYSDLPQSLENLFIEVNEWMNQLLENG